MAGRTPILDLTIPDVNDLIPSWPSIAAQGLIDLENSMIQNERKSASAAESTYPIGLSMFGLTSTGADEEGWPTGSGIVITFRRPLADLAFQIKVSQGVDRAPHMFIRTGAPSYGWSPWARAGSRDLPWAVASGTVTISDVASGASKTATVALPADVFTKSPVVSITTQSTNPNAFTSCIGAVTKTSFPIIVHRLATGTGSVLIHWTAQQAEV